MSLFCRSTPTESGLRTGQVGPANPREHIQSFTGNSLVLSGKMGCGKRQNQRTETVMLVWAVAVVYICRVFYTLQSIFTNISFAPLVITLQRKVPSSKVTDEEETTLRSQVACSYNLASQQIPDSPRCLLSSPQHL